MTANFDGVQKHRTVIGDDVKLGVDPMMVAPLTIGAGAVTGAGAVAVQFQPPEGLRPGQWLVLLLGICHRDQLERQGPEGVDLLAEG